MAIGDYVTSRKVEIVGLISALAILGGTSMYCNYAYNEVRRIEEDTLRIEALERVEAKKLDDLVQAGKQILNSKKELTDLTKF